MKTHINVCTHTHITHTLTLTIIYKHTHKHRKVCAGTHNYTDTQTQPYTKLTHKTQANSYIATHKLTQIYTQNF